MRVERLPQTVQADVLASVFHRRGHRLRQQRHQLRCLRRARGVVQGRVVRRIRQRRIHGQGHPQLAEDRRRLCGAIAHAGAGAYTLLATYERPFKAQGETLSFTGARPLDAQSEQGYTLVTSAYQFQVKPAEVSPSLLPLETGEVPPEYRLFFDAPVLAAYRYAARPFNLTLALSPLAQGDSLNQIVDRASLDRRAFPRRARP